MAKSLLVDRDDLMTQIRRNWSRDLQVLVSRDSNFFELGGTSLAAVESAVRISNCVGQSVKAHMILYYATP
jgi:hypothetical protein